MAVYEEFYPWRDARVVRALVVALFVLPTGLILGLGTELTTKPWYTMALAIGLPFLVGVLLLFGGMRTTVAAGMLRIRAWPFIDRRIPLADIESAHPMRIGPADRGRPTPDAKGHITLSLHDGEGIEVRLRGGQTMLIGSTRPARLVESLGQDGSDAPTTATASRP